MALFCLKAFRVKTKQEKLISAVTSAVRYLEESLKSISEESNEGVSGLVWRAAADLEYALFLFSVMRQDDSEKSSWKLGAQSREIEVESVIVSARDLLKEAENSIEADELHEAHKNAWMARGYLLKLQQFFDKREKLRKAAAKS